MLRRSNGSRAEAEAMVGPPLHLGGRKIVQQLGDNRMLQWIALCLRREPFSLPFNIGRVSVSNQLCNERIGRHLNMLTLNWTDRRD